jgi:hypothetical protein
MRRPIPLRWIEEAEAREVRRLALLDRLSTPEEGVTAATTWASLERMRAWLVPGNPPVTLTRSVFRGRTEGPSRGTAEQALPQRSSC